MVRGGPGRSGAATRQEHPIALLLILLLSLPVSAEAQRIDSGITPDSNLVGDRFHAVIRIYLPEGTGFVLPDTFPISGAVENAGVRQQASRELSDGTSEVTILYPLRAWNTGQLSLPPINVTLTGAAGPREESATFPSAHIHSVLPTDTAALAPMPPKDVIGGARLIWPWVAALLAISLAVGALVYYPRRGPELTLIDFELADPGSPQQRALTALDRVREDGIPREDGLKEFYSRTSTVIRNFLAELNSDWGTELTTTELLDRCSGYLGAESVHSLQATLASADEVKFNRYRSSPDSALSDWEAARHWVKSFQLRSVPPYRQLDELISPPRPATEIPGSSPDHAGEIPGQDDPGNDRRGPGRGEVP